MPESEEEVTTVEPSQTLSLNGKPDNDDDDDDNQAYRFVQIGKDLLVYGGSDGLLVRACDQETVRRWEDDAIRAVAVSPNQRTVAVGLDSGEVELYDFANYYHAGDGSESAHPFCAVTTNKDDDDDDAFLSQSDQLFSPRPSDKMRKGPRAESSIRQCLFLNDKYLAIASESGLCIANVSLHDDDDDKNTRDDDAVMPTFLTEQAKAAHQGGGVRGLAWNAAHEILTSLAMDGKICYWHCPLQEAAATWKLWRREPHLSVTKPDVGEILGADAWDRSTRPFQHGPYLAIPGSNYWQLLQWSGSRDTAVDYEQLFQTDVSHSKPMVAVAARGTHWVTTDRNGEIILWQLVSSQ